MASVSLCELDSAAEVLVNEETVWEEVEFEVALDSGSVVHVCAMTDTPGYSLQPSPGSKRGQNFMMGDGGKVPNQGQVALNMGGGSGTTGNIIQSVFQVAAVTRPLMSVGRICDEGMFVDFKKDYATVSDKSGREILRFVRQSGVLCVAKMKLKAPTFGRQE